LVVGQKAGDGHVEIREPASILRIQITVHRGQQRAGQANAATRALPDGAAW
jgi:hypothetical protein